mgnify:FL=1
MYDSIAILLNKGGDAHIYLRLLTSIELFENASHYSQYTYLIDLFEKNKNTFLTLHSIYSYCLTFDSIECAAAQKQNDKDKKGFKDDIASLIRYEAINNCELNRFSSFLCIVALSSVIRRRIVSHYPECGMAKYRLIFNTTINPRLFAKYSDVHVLWCNTNVDTLKMKNWGPNHFVPLVKKIDCTSLDETIKKRNFNLVFPKAEKISGVQSKIKFIKKSVPLSADKPSHCQTESSKQENKKYNSDKHQV